MTLVIVSIATSHRDTGGASYGSLYDPAETGSQGADGNGGASGGRGGGKFRISVGGIFQLDGLLEADGGAGSNAGGGGSGGSVWITSSKEET